MEKEQKKALQVFQDDLKKRLDKERERISADFEAKLERE